MDTAHENAVQVITGFFPTAGTIVGFLQGGGSGPLASSRGLAADQILELAVVTVSGQSMTVTPTNSSDLYWAISGGGGGTYGVVISATLRAFDDGIVGGAAIVFSRNEVSTDLVYDILGCLLVLVPSLIEAGMQFGWQVTKTSFDMGPLIAPGFTVQQVCRALEPFTTRLDNAGIQYELNVTFSPSYKDHFEMYLGPSPAGRYQANAMVGSRLIPRDSLTINRTALINVTRNITENSSTLIVFLAANVTHPLNKQLIADNAVLPQWRQAAVHALETLIWDFDITRADMLARQADLVEQYCLRMQGRTLTRLKLALRIEKKTFSESTTTNYDILRASMIQKTCSTQFIV